MTSISSLYISLDREDAGKLSMESLWILGSLLELDMKFALFVSAETSALFELTSQTRNFPVKFYPIYYYYLLFLEVTT